MYKILMVLMLGLVVEQKAFSVRVKDIANVRGIRDNQLIGYGLVVGLADTGDGKSAYTNKSLAQMFRRMGIEVTAEEAKSKNTAAAIVTAVLPPFPRVGNKIDIVVSSVGDAKSLQGGTLLLTPLKGGDQNVYAVAQGPLSIGGFAAQGNKGNSVQKNHPTVGYIPNGATIEREVAIDFSNVGSFTLSLNNPDFTTASRIVHAINEDLSGKYARALDPGTVQIYPPYGWDAGAVEFLARLESIDVNPDTKAKVIINERTGTVVMGEHLRISPVAIAHGALSIEIKTETKEGKDGKSTTTESVKASDGGKEERVILVNSGATIKEVVKALNSIGVTPRDLITVFQAIKASGALQADLVIM